MGERLDSTGLTYFWGKIKSYISGKIVDNLTSTSTTDALSAKQGRVLLGKFDDLNQRIKKYLLTPSGTVHVEPMTSSGKAGLFSFTSNSANTGLWLVVRNSNATADTASVVYALKSSGNITITPKSGGFDITYGGTSTIASINYIEIT